MAREFICLYFSWLETGATLTDEEFGRMCRAGLQYGLDGTEPDLPGNDKILFPVMKWQVDRDVSKFDEICQKRREAGSRGGKSKSKQSEANQANATFAKQNEANLCTPVSAAQVKPGDLVFFKGTYDTPGVSHCGIYVGNSIMLHCGDPISYTNINSKYWQEHFYSYGRLP